MRDPLEVVGDYRRVLDRNDIDAVLIGTPDFSHARITAAALAAGKHVYVEKPIANNIAALMSDGTPLRTAMTRVRPGDTHARSPSRSMMGRLLAQQATSLCRTLTACFEKRDVLRIAGC